MSAICEADSTVGESGAVIYIKNTQDKIVPSFNRENRYTRGVRLLKLSRPDLEKGRAAGKVVAAMADNGKPNEWERYR